MSSIDIIDEILEERSWFVTTELKQPNSLTLGSHIKHRLERWADTQRDLITGELLVGVNYGDMLFGMTIQPHDDAWGLEVE